MRRRIATRLRRLAAAVEPPREGEARTDVMGFVARRELEALDERVHDFIGDRLAGRASPSGRVLSALRTDLEAIHRWGIPALDRQACGLLGLLLFGAARPRYFGDPRPMPEEPPIDAAICTREPEGVPPRTDVDALHGTPSLDDGE
jgi:hypothetical protein